MLRVALGVVSVLLGIATLGIVEMRKDIAIANLNPWTQIRQQCVGDVAKIFAHKDPFQCVATLTSGEEVGLVVQKDTNQIVFKQFAGRGPAKHPGPVLSDINYVTLPGEMILIKR